MMKQTLTTLLLLCGMCGCNEKYPAYIIMSKSYYNYYGERMPDKICRYFFYDENNNCNEFQDSSQLYKVGDTLNFRIK